MAKRTLIAYHDGCLDGFVAGMIAHTKAIYDGLPNIRMIPVNYNDSEFHCNPGDDVILVDFCLEPEHIQRLRKIGVNITIVDHHETQIKRLYKAAYGKVGEQVHHNINYSCDCRDKDNHFFSKLVQTEQKAQGEYRAFLSDNREASPMVKECGASMAFTLGLKNEDFYQFMLTFLTVSRPGVGRHYELQRTIDLVRTHDLWLHDGKIHHDATYLSMWFKKFMKDNKELREMFKEPRLNSFDVFAQLKARFLLTSLTEKLEIGRKITDVQYQEAHNSCFGAVKLTLNLSSSLPFANAKFGFIPGDFSKKNISMTGSVLVKEYGFDVAVMEALQTEDTITYSLRSDQHGANVDVGALCLALAENGHAIKGGGHRNAAGVTFKKDAPNPFELNIHEQNIADFKVSNKNG